MRQQLDAANRLLQKGRSRRAGTAATKLKESYPDEPDVWALASEIALREGNLAVAHDEMRQAVRLNPKNARRQALLARCAVLCGVVPEALESAGLAIENGLSTPDDLLMLAAVLVRCDDHEGALELYQRVERVQPDRNELQRGIATVSRFLGRIDEAETACDRAIAADPHDYEMLNLRSSLRRQTTDSNHVDALESLIETGCRDWRGAVQVHYALAKEYEDLENYDAAFSALTEGGSLRRRNAKYDVNDDVKIFDAIGEAFTEDSMQAARGRGYPSAAPIFVLGLPRTGSTLVERIISSHSSVVTAGELNDFAIEMMRLVVAANDGRQPDRLALPSATLDIDLRELGRQYLDAASARVDGAKRFIDKLPLNSLYVGLIFLALPNAKVVHVRRHPVDTCFAMYKYLFKNAYPFSYDLDDLATYYIAHHRLMTHWRRLLPAGWMYELDYEALVANQRQTTEALLQQLGLPWEDACLEFHRNTQASTTGSASQVREALYSSSVGRWRKFERHLAPLVERLRDADICLEDT